MKTMFQLKPISKEGIAEALKKAERYRLLNEPRLSESICEDILAIDPENHDAVITMLLAITDQFGRHSSATVNKARQLIPRIHSEYERHYYSGIICERQGIAILNQGILSGNITSYHWLVDAMEHFEDAEAIHPPGNEDAILRWNTCARLIMTYNLHPRQEHYMEPPLE